MSILSLVVEWVLGFSTLTVSFLFLSAAVGVCPTVFSGWGAGLVYWCRYEPCIFDGILCEVGRAI